MALYDKLTGHLNFGWNGGGGIKYISPKPIQTFHD